MIIYLIITFGLGFTFVEFVQNKAIGLPVRNFLGYLAYKANNKILSQELTELYTCPICGGGYFVMFLGAIQTTIGLITNNNDLILCGILSLSLAQLFGTTYAILLNLTNQKTNEKQRDNN